MKIECTNIIVSRSKGDTSKVIFDFNDGWSFGFEVVHPIKTDRLAEIFNTFLDLAHFHEENKSH